MSELKIFDNKQLIHIASEVVVLIGVIYHFSSKNKKLMGHIEELAQKIEDQELQIQEMKGLIKQLNQKVDVGFSQIAQTLQVIQTRNEPRSEPVKETRNEIKETIKETIKESKTKKVKDTPKEPENFLVTIVKLNGENIKCKVLPSDKIGSVKEKTNLQDFNFVVLGRILDDEKTINDYNILENNLSIHCIKKESPKKVNFVEEIPDEFEDLENEDSRESDLDEEIQDELKELAEDDNLKKEN